MSKNDEFYLDFVAGQGRVMQDIFSKIAKICKHDVSVLIEGESGTGKELIARAIHYNSPRKNNEFVVINCSAFSDSLLESELFGHLRGSFTGAVHEKKGLFEVANNGTFFLDEIADMSPALQVKLLRVLQEGTFLKIGGIEPVKVDVRIIAASNKRLKTMIAQNEFREDLFYRINVTSISLPPLRERKEDIDALVAFFLSQHRVIGSGDPIRIAEEAMTSLHSYNWPGNIRQLENEIERAVIFARDGVITRDILSPEILACVRSEVEDASEHEEFDLELGLATIKKKVVERLERRLIVEGLEKNGWNKTECAKMLKVSRGDLMRKIAKYQIVSPS